MKKDIHPKYQPIIFHDVSCNKSFLISSTLNPKEKMMYEDGKEYPVFKIETSSESHPFYTGKGRMETKEGRIAQFRKRYIAEPKTEEKAQTSAQPKTEEKAQTSAQPKTEEQTDIKAESKPKPKTKAAAKPKTKAKTKK